MTNKTKYKQYQSEQLEKLNLLLDKETYYISNTTINILHSIFKEGEQVEDNLIHILKKRLIINKKKITLLDGLIFNKLRQTKIESTQDKLYQIFPNGIITFKSSKIINYQPLEDLLSEQKFKDADKLTQQYLCKLAQPHKTNKRQWLYFTDIELLPENDLFIIDLLWRIYSNNKFGFSIQRNIWIVNNYDWDTLWEQIGWLKNGTMRKYPEEFFWTINAPTGHLPLFNQLRGNKVLYYLFKHSIWKKIQNKEI